MSGKSSFREAFERRAAIPVERPEPSGTRADLLLRVNRAGMSKPVAVARLLTAHGVSLRKAHAVVDRVAAGDSLAVDVVTEDLGHSIERFRDLGVDASEIRRPAVDAKQIREGFALSQKDFATRFGLELRTIQNWEQRRYDLDPAATILLALIRDAPAAVEEVLTSAPRQRDRGP